MFSGERIEWSQFERGWLLPMGGNRAHYASFDGKRLTAPCGWSRDRLPSDSFGPVAFEAGSWTRCGHCERRQ